ncbi:isoprenylcysteine carboxylmethyltransferase family protein [Christensenellaceae bacterium OttesenSCG-928-L17]|nr:isoprenylcysteine carboxylmethyltransferase family protein [Christensenellaceae bacterium OttesenSCG-928-L17]
MNITVVNFICAIVIGLSVIALCLAIFSDFKRFNHRKGEKHSRKSLVATGTMFAFFGLYYLVLLFRLFALPIHDISMIAGTLLVVSGTIINIVARAQLGNNWANHIKIYTDHKLITTGLYSICRHPLYSSLFLALFGGALAYSNWFAAILTASIFIPMMNYRAKQEEVLLSKEFPEYKNYKKKVRRFI